MGGNDSDKTEEPTEHKLQEQRKKGQVMKSQEVISTLGLLAAVGVMFGAGSLMWNGITGFSKAVWGDIPGIMNRDDRAILPDIIWIMFSVLKVLLPLLVAVFIMGVISNLAQVGFLFATEPLKPSLKKMNPIQGFKKIFSVKSLMELVKQIAKLSFIGIICYKVVSGELGKFAMAPGWSLEETIALILDLIVQIVKYVLLGMTAIAGIDYAFQKKQFMKQMRMSHKDLKDEYKETEGNPEVKGKIRQMMQQGAQGRMSGEVSDASAVVTNPTHLAIAIKYDKDTCPVPTVVAKGERINAQKIKVVAEDAEVPIIENVELARALFGACEVGQAVPAELYKGVAEVLAYVIKLKRKKKMRLLQRKNAGRRG